MTALERRLKKLHMSRDLADSLEALVSDDVANFFASLRSGLIEEMVSAPAGADAKRRDSALYIKTLDKLQAHINNKIKMGREAEKQIEKIERRDEDD